MSACSTIPDLISSSVNLDLDKSGNYHDDSTCNSASTMFPFVGAKKSVLQSFAHELSSILRLNETKKILIFLCLNMFGTGLLFVWCHDTNSMALTAYTYLTLFDIFSLLTCLLSIWVRLQRPSPAYSFGYERFEVLATFATTMLCQLGALFVIKESIERVIQQPEIHTGRLLIGVMFAFMLHMFLTYSVDNKALNHVIAASSSSWLQEHTTDISESLCHWIPGLSKLLLPRINPLALIAFCGGFTLTISHVLIDSKSYYTSDTVAAVSIAFMTIGTMFPMAVYTGKILLQTTPAHMLGQLDKVLREASTLDGVLEFREEHFWTLSFGSLAGSVQVRVRRDANEQLVLAHVYNRLANVVSTLTIQIFKDDWTRASSYSIMGGGSVFPSNYTYSGPPIVPARGPSPTQDLGFISPTGSPSKQVPLSGQGHGHSHGGQGHGHSHGGHGHSHGGHKSHW
ncbi:zinc transporter 6-like isoform X2 [Dreissena polymorpha]|uniref:zinc transporter 6-like isoform X2 n=1 Tax=Dreissena polymorpha TaxID=45954 RepID=UPI002264822A|nr:zinc transporter 6-like isoform X2 [Dreissena polymorpha]